VRIKIATEFYNPIFQRENSNHKEENNSKKKYCRERRSLSK
jgi:hypothetical protein